MADNPVFARPSLRQLRAKRPGNVVILPTAAPRQVQQPQNQAGRVARKELRAQSGNRFAFKFPGDREAARRAAIIRETPRTPEICLAFAILAELDRDTRQRIIDRLARSEGGEAGSAALELARATVLTVGEQCDLARAFEELEQ